MNRYFTGAAAALGLLALTSGAQAVTMIDLVGDRVQGVNVTPN